MIFETFPPALILLFAAFMAVISRPNARAIILLAAPLITLWAIWSLPDGVLITTRFLGYPIEPLEVSPIRRMFATVFTIMAFTGALFSFRTAKTAELGAAFAYASGAVGVSFAGDLITLFIWWEIMAIFSTIVVWCGGTEASRRAGIRYAMMHLLSGILLKIGIEGVYVHTGSLDVQAMLATDFDRWLILIGILINAAAPPFSAWLPDAYPETSPTGAVFLSAFTTKTAVLALILLFPGEQVLIWIGLYMVFYGIIYALLENDARRILAYSIINQVGFMVCAIGIGTELALNGAALHAFAHIIYKALLLMSAGVVIYRTGMRKCTDLGGLFRTMPVTCICGIIGALAISSFPLTSGYTTKTMISVAAEQQHLVFVWYMLAAASAGVFLHAGIKFPWFVFFQKDSGLRPKDAPWNMAAAMIFFAFLCVALGIYPDPLYAMLPNDAIVPVYKPEKVVFYLQLLLFSGLAFFLLLNYMKRTLTITLDLDWIWRVAILRAGNLVYDACAVVRTAAEKTVLSFLKSGQARLGDLSERDGLILRATSATGLAALYAMVLLTLYILVYYLD
ncbi:MAG: Na(+)/H(+) antiporter subunit D [Anderseniella sp.]|nr:Na(+)/H(+) antiporter subunit D [Anderseniella sp.]